MIRYTFQYGYGGHTAGDSSSLSSPSHLVALALTTGFGGAGGLGSLEGVSLSEDPSVLRDAVS